MATYKMIEGALDYIIHIHQYGFHSFVEEVQAYKYIQNLFKKFKAITENLTFCPRPIKLELINYQAVFRTN